MQGTTTRYVLGFDAECSFCVEVAEEIRDRFGEHLELRDLREVEMAEWRREALSENPAWTPVLVKISGENVSLYSGYRLGLALAWRLGPVSYLASREGPRGDAGARRGQREKHQPAADP